MPISTTTAYMSLALHPMSKKELKANANYYQLLQEVLSQGAVSISENNAKYLTVKLGIGELVHAMGILPDIEDLRKEEEVANISPSSPNIRKALNNFLRRVSGLNNKSAKKEMKSMEDMATDIVRSCEADYIWPESGKKSPENVAKLGKKGANLEARHK